MQYVLILAQRWMEQKQKKERTRWLIMIKIMRVYEQRAMSDLTFVPVKHQNPMLLLTNRKLKKKKLIMVIIVAVVLTYAWSSEKRAHNRFDRIRTAGHVSPVPAVRSVVETRPLARWWCVRELMVSIRKTADWYGGGCLHPSPRQQCQNKWIYNY